MVLRALLVALFCIVLGFEPAQADHQAVRGTKLVLKNPHPTGRADQRRWRLEVEERGSDATVVGDPTTQGATISLFTEGTTATSQSWVLPQGMNSRGRPLWRKQKPSGFSYHDPDGINGPVRVLTMTRSRNGKFEIVARVFGENGPIAVVPPNSGSRACVRVDLGGGDSYHVLFGADSTIGRNDATMFLSEEPASAGLCCGLGTSPPCCPSSCPGDACQLGGGTCDVLEGVCRNQPRPDGTTCDQGLSNVEPMTCNAGACETCTPSGNCACTADTECPTGQTCNGGLCQCTADTQCASGEVCSAGSCTCTDDADCAFGQSCSGGLCATPARACAFDQQCTQGHCILTTPPSPRFVDNEDGTVTDRQTCLVWEKKDAYDGVAVDCPGTVVPAPASCDNLHDADNRYTGGFYGSAFASFLYPLRDASFAGHTTWRLPGSELLGLVDLAAPQCGGGGPCIGSAFDNNCVPTCSGTDPACSCTVPAGHWTGISTGFVDFLTGATGSTQYGVDLAVRAVRGCTGLRRPFVLPNIKANCFNQCAIECQNDGQCIFGCMVGQDDSEPRCYADCDGFAPACLQSCLETITCIDEGDSGNCTIP